jgi:hypothetical protein
VQSLLEVEEVPKIEDEVQAQEDYQNPGDHVYDLGDAAQESSGSAEQNAQGDEKHRKAEHEQEGAPEYPGTLSLTEILNRNSPYQRQVGGYQRQNAGGEEAQDPGGKGDCDVDIVRHHVGAPLLEYMHCTI